MPNDSTTSPGGNQLLEAAHLAAKRGWRVIPLHRVAGGKYCSCKMGGNCKSAGKHPQLEKWQQTEPLSAADIQATWDVDKPPNLGIATGEASGFWVLDIDPDNGGAESARRLVEQYGNFPATHIVKTGSGGYHYYFAMPDFPVTNRRAWFKENGYPGIDIRGTGGQVVAPPSVSDKGAYEVVVEATPATAPDWLLEAVRPPVEGPVVTAADLEARVVDLPEHERTRAERYFETIRSAEIARLRKLTVTGWHGEPWNQTTFDVACVLIQLSNSPWAPYSIDQAYADVFGYAPRDENFGDDVVNKCFSSARGKIGEKARDLPADRRPPGPVYPGDPLTDPTAGTAGEGGAQSPAAVPAPGAWPMRPWDDLGNSQRMVDHYGDRLRWVEQAGAWAVYTGGRWELDELGVGHSMAQEMIESLPATEALSYADELESPDDKETPRARFLSWVSKQRSSGKISAALRETQGRREMQARVTDFDGPSHAMLLNVANGVVDLATGELLPHDPALMLMQQSPVAYDPDAAAPRWEKFLTEVMPQEPMRAYLQRICGYSLTGKIGEQAMFMHWGAGANGKSVLLQLATHISGDYGQVVPRQTLLVNQSEQHPEAVARMIGKRFLQTSETAAGRRLDEEVVKGLTGGEKQTARFMHKGSFDFTPSGKLHYVTNHLPRLTNAESIWRRLHLIGWKVVIPVEDRDPELAQRIIAEEAAGVLAWMVRGAVAWWNGGAYTLDRPIESMVDLQDYRDDQDEFGDFLRECLVPAKDKEHRVPTAQVYDAYTAWCWRSGIKTVMKKADLARTLRERGVLEYRTSTERGFKGMRLLAQHEVAGSPAAPRDPLK